MDEIQMVSLAGIGYFRSVLIYGYGTKDNPYDFKNAYPDGERQSMCIFALLKKAYQNGIDKIYLNFNEARITFNITGRILCDPLFKKEYFLAIRRAFNITNTITFAERQRYEITCDSLYIVCEKLPQAVEET